VALALEAADFGQVKALAIDETSRARGHDDITLAADAAARRVLSVTEGRDAKAVQTIAQELAEHGCPPETVEFHIVWHASAAVDKMRRIEQRSDKSLKGLRWSLRKDRADLEPDAAADLDALIARMTRVRTARAWAYKEQLREILERKQINVVRDMLKHWCACVMRSKVEPMKEVAAMVRRHLEGLVAWAQTRQTNGFLGALAASSASTRSGPSSS